VHDGKQREEKSRAIGARLSSSGTVKQRRPVFVPIPLGRTRPQARVGQQEESAVFLVATRHQRKESASQPLPTRCALRLCAACSSASLLSSPPPTSTGPVDLCAPWLGSLWPAWWPCASLAPSPWAPLWVRCSPSACPTVPLPARAPRSDMQPANYRSLLRCCYLRLSITHTDTALHRHHLHGHL